jgi:pimeloyl-ACP methyl ester carboxylesterase
MIPLLVAAAMSGSIDPPQDREVSLGQGPAALHGSLLAPSGHPRVAVLLIAGSGPTDRDGNGPTTQPETLKQLAQGLALRGIASLRFDKRGIAASAGGGVKESELRFTTYVDDAVSWAGELKRQTGASCIILAGHSEGALVATLAAAKTPVCGLVLISGAGRPAGAVLREQLKARGTPAQRVQANTALKALEAGKTTSCPPGLEALFRPGAQPYLISWLSIDPAKAVARVRIPTLIIHGTTDLQVSAQDFALLANARPDVKSLSLDGVNHVLKRAPSDPAANFAAYRNPLPPIDGRVVPAVADFAEAAAGWPK